MIVITKKKALFKNKDLESLEKKKNYVNVIFYYNKLIFSNSKKSKDKIYLNYRSFYLNKNNLDEIETTQKINQNNINNFISSHYKLKNVKYCKIIYNKMNLFYIIVKLDKMEKFLDNFQWINQFDFYHINPDIQDEDLFENILNNNNELYKANLKNNLNVKYKTSKYITSEIKLKNIYESMVGDFKIIY